MAIYFVVVPPHGSLVRTQLLPHCIGYDSPASSIGLSDIITNSRFLLFNCPCWAAGHLTTLLLNAMSHHSPSSFPLPARVLNMALMELPLTLESTVKLSHTLSSVHIPRLGFGLYLSPPEATKNSVLEAIKCGYRHFDTAQYYENESQLGEAIRRSEIDRKDVFITTKILMKGGSVEKSLEKCWESVRRIGCGGYVDLFLIHSPSGGSAARKELWKALELLLKEGGTKAIGVSN